LDHSTVEAKLKTRVNEVQDVNMPVPRRVEFLTGSTGDPTSPFNVGGAAGPTARENNTWQV